MVPLSGRVGSVIASVDSLARSQRQALDPGKRWVLSVPHLDPVRASAGVIGAIATLRHHGLESHVAGGAEKVGVDLALLEGRVEDAFRPARQEQ